MSDMNTLLVDYCRRLRLSSRFAERALTMEKDDCLSFLAELLRCEIDDRNAKRLEKRLKAATFPRRYRLEQFSAEQVEFPPETSLAELCDLKFYDECNNVIMYGGTGTGKTMLSICLGLEACRRGISTKFYRTAALVNELAESKANGCLSSLRKKLERIDLLILDEFGYVPYDRNGAQLLFDYLSEIYEQKPIILNTNLEFSRWPSILYDEQMASALVGRLIHHCHLLLFLGENHRVKESNLSRACHKL